jgi:hypothetical protein
MKMYDRLAAVPERIYVLAFLGVFVVTAFFAYFARQDTALLEVRIAARQRELADILQLRDVYEARKHELDGRGLRKPDSQPVSLALVEGLVNKSFVGGSLTAMTPATGKGEKGNGQMVVELKVAGAALGEIVTYVKAAENAGMRVVKLRLSQPSSNPTALDMQATVVERRSHG